MIVSLFVYLLAIVSTVFSYEIQPSLQRGLGSVCKTNDNCDTPNSHCIEQSCECRTGYTVDGSLIRCLKVANGYYDTCEESIQCSTFLGAGGKCKSGQCVCADKYHYLQGQCYESRGLKESCSVDEECFVNADYQAASCLNGICKCSERFYQREYSTCRPKGEKIGSECLIDLDCDFHEGATCASNKCALSERKTSNHDYGFVRKQDESSPNDDKIIIGDSKCEVDADCNKMLDYSICAANNTCVCQKGYFATRVKLNKRDFMDGCAPEIGTVCDPEVQYKFNVTSATCKNNLWTCDIDKVAIKDNRLCRKVTLEIGKQCLYPEQCQIFGPKAKCVSNKCECNEISHLVPQEKFCWKTSKIGEVCESNYDCYSRGFDQSPTCVSNICTCPENSIASDDHGYCYSKEPELGFYCEKDEECEPIPNSRCGFYKCACAETFFELGNKCVAGLNAVCDNDDDCKLENTECKTIGSNQKKCQCTQKFTVGPDDICIEKSRYKQDCIYDVQCSAEVKNTFCNMTTIEEEDGKKDDDDKENAHGRCDCIEDYYFIEDSCYKKKWLGQECSRLGECFTNSSVCRNGICSCDFNFEPMDRQCRPKNSSSGLHFDLWLVIALVAAIVTTIP